MLALSTSSALWYLTRATGVVALLALTSTLALGVVGVGRWQARGWPRFVTQGLHRNLSLLAVAFLVVHVLTSVLDPYAPIRLADALIPFISAYRPFWLGLGALSLDLLVAVLVTSVLRRHLPHRLWRAVHWAAYLCWPLALFHVLGTGSDIKQPWMQAVVAACVLTAAASVTARVSFAWPRARTRTRQLGALAAVMSVAALPVSLALWLPSGPLAANWAHQSGTPVHTLAAPVATSPANTLSAFTAAVSGQVSQHDGGGVRVVDISLASANSTVSRLALQLIGKPSGSGVRVTSTSVAAGPVSDPTRYRGTVTTLDGTTIGARLTSPGRPTLQLTLLLQTGASGAVSGSAQVSTL